MLIYMITNTVNGMKYIGQTTRSIKIRWAQHCRPITKSEKGCPYISRAITKYGKDLFSIEIIYTATTMDELNEKEEQLISSHGTLSPNGYNLDSGGKNRKMHPDTKAKIAASGLGRVIPPEHREKISKAKLGVKFSKEHCESMRRVKIGKPINMNQEARKASSLRALARNGPRPDSYFENNGRRWFEVYSLDGKMLGQYINMTKCAKDLGTNKAQVSGWVNGKIKSRKYKLTYIDNPKVSK